MVSSIEDREEVNGVQFLLEPNPKILLEPNPLGLGEHRCGSTLQSLELLWHHMQQPIKSPSSIQSLKQGHHVN